MSDFFKKAAGLIFNVDDDQPESKPVSPVTPVNRVAAPVSSSPIPSNVVVESSVTEKFQLYFKSLYEKANQPGADFYEYYNMVEAMGSLIADDVKYPSVFAGFGDQVSKEKLLSSANYYLDLMLNDRQDFEKSLVTARQQKVQARKEQADKKSDQIKALQAQIADLNKDIIELNTQASDDDARLAAEETAYNIQSAASIRRIKSGIDGINQYLK